MSDTKLQMQRLNMDAFREYQRILFGIESASSSLQQLGAFDSASFHLHVEQPKPQHSYIGLIGMAILSSAERKMVLSEVYDWIMSHYPYFRSRGSGWRNSIRHNLSLNDCFIKAGRAANGKGHFWAIHPANVRDFERGDFRRRRAQRKVRRHMGLSVPEGESSDESPTPPPITVHPTGLSQLSLSSLFSFPLSFPLCSLPEVSEQRDESPDNEASRSTVPLETTIATKVKSFTIDDILRDTVV